MRTAESMVLKSGDRVRVRRDPGVLEDFWGLVGYVWECGVLAGVDDDGVDRVWIVVPHVGGVKLIAEHVDGPLDDDAAPIAEAFDWKVWLVEWLGVSPGVVMTESNVNELAEDIASLAAYLAENDVQDELRALRLVADGASAFELLIRASDDIEGRAAAGRMLRRALDALPKEES